MKPHEPDPELLAAYAEQALEGESRDAFETHLASCAACRDSVAALVRMAPRDAVVAAPARKWWGGWVWVMPAMATLGVLVMLRQPPAPQATPQLPKVAVVENREPAPAAAQPPPVEKRTARPANARAADTVADKLSDAKVTNKEVARTESAPRPASGEAFAPAPPLEAKDMKKESQQRDAAAQNNFVSPYVNSQNQAAQQNMPAARQRVVEELSASADAAAGGGGGRGPSVSPGASASLDAAKSTMQSAAAAPPPASPPAAAMAAPSALVGKSKAFAAATVAPTEIPVRVEKGVLSISIDAGLNWQVLKTPESVERAKFTDPLRGEIHTTSQHVYRTIDGGKNWQQQKQ